MTTLILLGLALGLDSFRVSIGLGMLRPTIGRQAALACVFGLCDGLAPLAGLLLGGALTVPAQAWADWLGPIATGLFGLYMIAIALRKNEGESDKIGAWAMFGLPLCLSVDNLIAGVGLGMLGYPPLISCVVIGTMSALLAFAGLLLGRVAAGRLPFNARLVGGMALVTLAVVIAFDVG